MHIVFISTSPLCSWQRNQCRLPVKILTENTFSVQCISGRHTYWYLCFQILQEYEFLTLIKSLRLKKERKQCKEIVAFPIKFSRVLITAITCQWIWNVILWICTHLFWSVGSVNSSSYSRKNLVFMRYPLPSLRGQYGPTWVLSVITQCEIWLISDPENIHVFWKIDFFRVWRWQVSCCLVIFSPWPLGRGAKGSPHEMVNLSAGHLESYLTLVIISFVSGCSF